MPGITPAEIDAFLADCRRKGLDPVVRNAAFPGAAATGPEKPKPISEGEGARKAAANQGIETSAFDQVALWAASQSLPEPERNIKFLETRRWKIDFGWERWKIGVEMQGGMHPIRLDDGRVIRGHHARPKDYRNDCDKLFAAQLAGWLLVWCPYDMLRDGGIYKHLGDAFAARLAIIPKETPCQA